MKLVQTTVIKPFTKTFCAKKHSKYFSFCQQFIPKKITKLKMSARIARKKGKKGSNDCVILQQGRFWNSWYLMWIVFMNNENRRTNAKVVVNMVIHLAEKVL